MRAIDLQGPQHTDSEKLVCDASGEDQRILQFSTTTVVVFSLDLRVHARGAVISCERQGGTNTRLFGCQTGLFDGSLWSIPI